MLYDLVIESVNPRYRAAALQAAMLLSYPRKGKVDGRNAYWSEKAHGLDVRTLAMHLDTAPCLLLKGIPLEDAERFKQDLEQGWEDSKCALPGPDEVACAVTIRESEDCLRAIY
jgi:hypothetical protein